MPNLKDLVSHREDILLAEVAAWLHDDFKHTDKHIYKHVAGAPLFSGIQKATDLIPSRTLSLLGKNIPFTKVQNRKTQDFIKNYLNRCHYTAHLEKEESKDGKQSYPAYLSSPFGYEGKRSQIPPNLTHDLRHKISWNLIGTVPFGNPERLQLYREIRSLFERVGGDTRRPANEITLWEWGHTVGALYKAALAGALLGFQPSANNLRWRLLSVRFDGLRFFFKVNRVSDLQARQKLLTEALDRVQELLEVTYPLGTEVYRDENGSVFVVPGCDKTNCAMDILTLQDGGKNLREYILEKVQSVLEGEVVPVFKVDAKPWWGQDPQRQGKDELPPIASHLQMVTSASDIGWVEQQWNSQAPSEVCTVCGLRPQGPSQKALARKVCDVCEQRRDDRAERWMKRSFSSTIWLGEVADTHHRLALIVGRFDLTHWLNGALVRSLAVLEPNAGNGHSTDKIAKNPSFARLRRIWETTRKFWQEVAPTDENNNLADSEAGRAISKESTQRKRLQIKGDLQPVRKGDTPGPYHAYELELPRGVRLSVVWDPENERFITADNLDYLEGKTQLGQPLKNVLRKGSTFQVLEPVGYGASDKVWGEITLSEDASDIPASEYTPLIPILAEPRTFMALVPADKAIEVVKAIRTKYEREMGKVRNRLPLHLGIVFADAHTPLRAILDAGRRMLKQQGDALDWEVKDVRYKHKQIKNGEVLPERFNEDVNGQLAEWYEVDLAKGDRKLTWYIPAVMGDGKTADNWYPYVFLAREDQPTDRNRYFSAPNPWNEAHKWLVHAGELKEGDIVYFTPATLDFQWLESSARRFEIAYDDNGQRKGNLSRRPYLLDELDVLEGIWKALSEHSTTSQIYALVSLIESRREDWRTSPQDDTFRAFCRDALINAAWRKSPWGTGREAREGWLDKWVNYAARGWLTDAVELWMKIMKQKPATETEGGNS